MWLIYFSKSKILNMTVDFIDMNFVREVRSRFYSDFVFECKMCGIEKKINLRKKAQKIIGL